MSREQFESENIYNDDKNRDYVFVCPQCGKEIKPSSFCEECFPNGSYKELTFEQVSFIDSDVYEIDEDILENKSVQVLDKEVNTIEDNPEQEHLTWQDFRHLFEVISVFYKRYKKKVWLISSVTVLLFTAYFTYQHFSPKGKLILFMEKRDLVYAFTKNPFEKIIIEKNWNPNLKGSPSDNNRFSAVRASLDDKYIFYRKQKMTTFRDANDALGTYYRYDVEQNKKIKIDDQIQDIFTRSSTNISPDGLKAMYLKGLDNKLVFWNNGKKITIDNGVGFYFVNKQTTHVYYAKLGDNNENQGDIYEWSEKSGKKSVSEKAVFQGLQMDQKGELTIYYKKDQSIYLKKEDKPSKQIAANADRILSYSGEKVYYTVSAPLPFTYRDFVNDNLEESDKKIEKLTAPLGSYDQKVQRDVIRQSFDKQITSVASDLFYFDGKKSTLLDNNINVTNYYLRSMDKPILIYRKLDDNLFNPTKEADFIKQKIDIGTAFSLDQLNYFLSQIFLVNSKVILAQGTQKGVVDQNCGNQFMISPNGKWISFIDDSLETAKEPWNSYYTEKGKLKKFKIEDLTEFKPTVIDDGVSTNTYFFNGNNIYYTKGSFDSTQSINLFVNGKKLLTNFDSSTLAMQATLAVLSPQSLNNESEFYGLEKSSKFSKLYKINGDKKQEIAKNVFMYTTLKNNSVMYIKDYVYSEGTGKLMFDDGKNKPILISNQASMIFQNYDFPMYY